MQYCAEPGCPALVRRGRCPRHNSKLLYYRAPWKRLRAQVLRDQVYACAQCGRVQRQLEVDHIVKHEGDVRRFHDRANLQALCHACHVAKSQQGA